MTSPVPPVLIIGWRRPALIKAVIDAVRLAAPSKVFVAVDGPDVGRRPHEGEAVAQTIATIEAEIDWPCSINRRYSPENQGCRLGVSGAIDWFFTHVDAGIVLEDDCVPHLDFFAYCAQLLKQYRSDPRVMCISGDNSANVHPARGRDYTFVRYPQIWGWATWRRAWQRYDRDLTRYRQARSSSDWDRLVPNKFERETFQARLDEIASGGGPDTWDYQWAATLLLDRGLSVHPRVNLVTNIGFGVDATHTFNEQHPRAGVPAGQMSLTSSRIVARLDRLASRRLFRATQVSKKELARRRWSVRASGWARKAAGHVARRLRGT
jgi:hypothetical protein